MAKILIFTIILLVSEGLAESNATGRYRGSIPQVEALGNYSARFRTRVPLDWKVKQLSKSRITVSAYLRGILMATATLRGSARRGFTYQDEFLEIFGDGVTCDTIETAVLSQIRRRSAQIELREEASCDGAETGYVVYRGRVSRR